MPLEHPGALVGILELLAENDFRRMLGAIQILLNEAMEFYDVLLLMPAPTSVAARDEVTPMNSSRFPAAAETNQHRNSKPALFCRLLED